MSIAVHMLKPMHNIRCTKLIIAVAKEGTSSDMNVIKCIKRLNTSCALLISTNRGMLSFITSLVILECFCNSPKLTVDPEVIGMQWSH